MSLALTGDTIAYLMGLGLSAEQMKGLIDRLNRDALAMAPPSSINGINEETERLRNGSTYAERKRAKDRERRAAEREELRRLKGEATASSATPPATSGEATSIEGDQPATPGDPEPDASCAQVVILTSSLRSEGNPPTHPSGASPKGVARSEKRERRSRFVPESWNPTEADAAYGAALGFTPGEMERELAKFRRFEFARPYSDWSRTLQNWLDRAAERSPRKAHDGPHHNQRQTAREDRLGRMLAGAVAAVNEREPGLD